MRYQRLGNSDLEVSVIGLGCATLSGLYGDYDAAEAPRVFDAAFEHGINFLDTSEIYGAQGLVQGVGHNERMIADAIRGRRDGLIIATKFGHIFGENDEYAIDARPVRVEPSCDACLERLGVDVIDLFYLHRVDANTPIEDTVGAMGRLVEKGKVRYLGLSEASPDTLRRGHASHPITALQSEYAIWCRDMEAEILPLCAELGIGFVAYAPLGRGILSGSVKGASDIKDADWRRDIPRFKGENLTRNLALVEGLKAVAAEKACSLAQLALAWILAQPHGVVPIPGSDRARYVAENAAAADIILTPGELQRIDDAVAADAWAGARKTAAQAKRTGI